MFYKKETASHDYDLCLNDKFALDVAEVSTEVEAAFNCAGTAGTAGTAGGCFGTVGSFGCAQI